MILVDSTVWIDVLRSKQTQQTIWLRLHCDDKDVALLDLIVCEVLQGLRPTENYDNVRTSLFGYRTLETGGTELAKESAANYRVLRERGITIRSTIDCIIAAYCIRGGHTLLHNHRDFDHFERYLGLKVLHPKFT